MRSRYGHDTNGIWVGSSPFYGNANLMVSLREFKVACAEHPGEPPRRFGLRAAVQDSTSGFTVGSDEMGNFRQRGLDLDSLRSSEFYFCTSRISFFERRKFSSKKLA